MKKYLKMILAFIMIFAMYTNVNAKMTGPFTITIENSKEGHTYDVYQIFAGDVSIAGSTVDTLDPKTLSSDKILSNITWGAGVKDSFKSQKGNAATYAATLLTRDTEAVAKELESGLKDTPTGSTNTMSNGKYTISNLPAGYYLIKDRNTARLGENDAATEYVIRLVDSISVNPKTSIPTADKKIVEDDKKVEVSSKYAVGDAVKYELIGTLPTNYDYYDSYKYIFKDNMSNGLTLNANSVKVYLVNGNNKTEITEGFTKNTSNQSLTVTFANLKTISSINSNTTIIVEYTAVVNKDAVRGLPGNDNTLVIEYSNNPDSDETGETTPEKTRVYVFNLKFDKIASDTNRLLDGAQFMLERKVNGRWTKVSGIDTDGSTSLCTSDNCIKYVVDADNATFHFNGIAAGEYRLTETVTPDGYNTITPVEFTVTANYDKTDPEEATILRGLTIDSAETNEVAKFTVEEEDQENPTISTIVTTITNIKGIQLPLTGGMGTTIFTIIGIILMGVAVVCFVTNKKEEM